MPSRRDWPGVPRLENRQDLNSEERLSQSVPSYTELYTSFHFALLYDSLAARVFGAAANTFVLKHVQTAVCPN